MSTKRQRNVGHTQEVAYLFAWWRVQKTALHSLGDALRGHVSRSREVPLLEVLNNGMCMEVPCVMAVVESLVALRRPDVERFHCRRIIITLV